MCGRFTLSASVTDLIQQFDLAGLPSWVPRVTRSRRTHPKTCHECLELNQICPMRSSMQAETPLSVREMANESLTPSPLSNWKSLI